MAPLLQLFGPPAWQGRPLPVERRVRLLAVLAVAADWVPRERLAQLFWPERTPTAARTNLRKLLLEARQLALPGMPGLEDGPAGLRWQPPSDLAACRAAMDRADWDSAGAWVRGPLLLGLEAGGGPGFDAWLRYERSAFQRRWRDGSLQALAAAAPDAARIDTTCTRLLAGDPLDEDVIAAWLRLARAAGAPQQAEDAWRRHVQLLADTHGVQPSLRLRRLAADDEPAEAAPALFGRDAELAQALDRLARGARLLTLLGPGGVGKTALARQLLRTLAPQREAAWMLALDDLRTPAALPGRIAGRLDPALALGDDPAATLARHWPAGPTLLVLDGFEAVIDAASFVQRLLARVPRLQVVATSRERLDVDGEWLLALSGLGAPPSDAAPGAVLQHPAVRLFRARAAQLGAGPDEAAPGLADAAALRAICAATEGLPLALELAASWARLLPCAEIARELAAGTALPAHGGRSMEQVFEQSWQLLTPAERGACVRLAVFSGGCTRDAAWQVADVALPLLASLVDKSMLRVDAAGRFDRHALLQAWARARLQAQPALAQEMAERHGRWCLVHLLRDHGGQAGLRTAIAAERDNVLAAWHGWVARGAQGALEAAAEVLSWFHVVEGRLPEAIALFDAAAAALGSAPATAALLRAHQAWLELWMERYAGAQARAAAALAVLQPAGHVAGALLALRTLAHGARREGRHGASSRLLGQALRLARPLADARQRAMLLDARAMALVMLGRHRRAAALVRGALRLNTIVGNDGQRMYNAFNLSQALGFAGETAAALGWADAAVHSAEQIGYRFFQPYARCQRAALALQLGRTDAAAADLQAALQESGAIGGAPGLVWAQELGARLALARGNAHAARAALQHGAAHAAASGNVLMGAALVPVAAQAAAACGDTARASTWLAQLLASPQVQAPVRAEAQALATACPACQAPAAMPPAPASAPAHAQATDLMDLLRRIADWS